MKTHYPYTYAEKIIQSILDSDDPPQLTRRTTKAARVREFFAEVLCMDDHELACKVVEHHIEGKTNE